ncbi:MAG: hypothetical protein JWL88_460 [Parcubacteria group bacterium]|nr:hypothetical protein [Parcubacteria group bacterium]
MIIRPIHISSALLALAALPFTVSAATDFFGPIIPQSGACICANPASAMDWGCVIIVFHNVLNALFSFGILAVVFFIAIAGFGLMTNGSNPAARTKARNRLLNAVVGLALILCSFLLVDTIMKALYDPNTAFSGGTFGPWNKILAEPGKECLAVNTTPIQLTDGSVIGSLIATGKDILNPGTEGSSATNETGNVPGPSTRGLCTPSSLQQAGWDSNLASKMSCVTKYENGSCNPSAPSGTDIGSDGKSVSIGIFQVNISANNMNYPACERLNGGQPLNCTQAFAGGAYTASNHSTHVSNPGLYTTCRAAASDPSCNTAAAQTIYQKQGIKAWGTAAQNNCS